MKKIKNQIHQLEMEVLQLSNYLKSGKFGRQYIVRKLGQISAEMILLKAVIDKEEGENNEK